MHTIDQCGWLASILVCIFYDSYSDRIAGKPPTDGLALTKTRQVQIEILHGSFFFSTKIALYMPCRQICGACSMMDVAVRTNNVNNIL